MNLNYIVIVKQNLDKLLVVEFIVPIEKSSWLSLIVIVSKKNKICHVDFRKLNATTKNDMYPLSCIKEVLNMVTWHQMYSFINGSFGYHQTKITSKDRHKTTFITNLGTFVWFVMRFGFKNVPPTYQWVVSLGFQEYMGVFMNYFWTISM
jgi:hypothetical protein